MQVEPDMLCEIILAADFLDIPDLLSQGCTTVSNMIKGTSSEQIRMTVGTLDFDESSALKRLPIRHSITSRLSGREISLLYKHLNIEMSKTDRERSIDIARNVFSDPIAIHDFINEGYVEDGGPQTRCALKRIELLDLISRSQLATTIYSLQQQR